MRDHCLRFSFSEYSRSEQYTFMHLHVLNQRSITNFSPERFCSISFQVTYWSKTSTTSPTAVCTPARTRTRWTTTYSSRAANDGRRCARSWALRSQRISWSTWTSRWVGKNDPGVVRSARRGGLYVHCLFLLFVVRLRISRYDNFNTAQCTGTMFTGYMGGRGRKRFFVHFVVRSTAVLATTPPYLHTWLLRVPLRRNGKQ